MRLARHKTLHPDRYFYQFCVRNTSFCGGVLHMQGICLLCVDREVFLKSLKIRKIREIFPKNLSDGISGNFGKYFPGIPGNSGNPRELFRKFGGFSQNPRCGAVYPSVNRGENRGKFGFFSKKVSGKSPENPPGNPREIPGKTGRFFPVFFGCAQRYSLFLENPRGKFRRKIPRCPGNFSPGNPPNPRKSRKFPEKKGQK